MKLGKKLLVILTAMMMVLLCLASCGGNPDDEKPAQLTNEQLIENRIKEFLTAYNSGDMDATLDCLDAKSRNAMSAMLNVVGGIAGAVVGVDIDLRDLFSLGIAIESDDFMKLQISSISVTDSKNAIATTTMDLTGAGVQTIYFYMVYENDGWYISDMTDRSPSGNNGSATQNPDGSNPSDTTLYYVTTYSNTSEYGTAGTYTEYNKQSFAVGSKVLLEATVNDGFNFEGWYLSEGWNSICLSSDLTYQYEMKSANANIEARYSYYTVNVGAEGDDYGMAGTYTKYTDKKVSVGDTVVLEATVNSGYNFEGWYAEGSNVCLSPDLRYEFVMKADHVGIYARYAYYTVNTFASGDEYGTAGTYTTYQDKKFSVGETVVLEATVNEGFNFEGWYAEWSDTCLSKDLTYSFVMKAENVGIEARWSYYTVTVECYSDESGIAGTYSAKTEEKVSVGDTVTLTATVNKGYNFEGWYVRWSDVCLSMDLTYSFEMKAEDVFIEARYSYYTITVYDACSGWFGEQRELGKVSAGEEVTLVASTYGGYRFEGWYINGGCVSTDSTYKFDMPNKDVYIEAIYAKIED